ncbi:developmental protein eyes absent-like [Drosophila biarmipes]|uniref:developmental protein eyes absent-like n=1 Tax=Drosophila biarmipes TaxID=125945 RepID=UPI001CDB00DA|nr:developmental protein eyes absent-like [Drosophila biarmipes]
MFTKVLGVLFLLAGQSLGDLKHLGLHNFGLHISRPDHSSSHHNNNAESEYNAFLNQYYSNQWQQYYQAQASYNQLYGPNSLYGHYGYYYPYGHEVHHGHHGNHGQHSQHGQQPTDNTTTTTTSTTTTTTTTPAPTTTTTEQTTSTAVATTKDPQTTSTAVATTPGPDTTSTALASSNAVARYRVHTTPLPYPYEPNPQINPYALHRIYPQHLYVKDPSSAQLSPVYSYVPYDQVQYVAKK